MFSLWFPQNYSTLTLPGKSSKLALAHWQKRYEKLYVESGLSWKKG